MQQEMFAAARARSLNSVDGNAAMAAAAYCQQVAASGAQQEQPDNPQGGGLEPSETVVTID